MTSSRFPVLDIDPVILDGLMQQARIEWLPNDRRWYATVPGVEGAWSQGETESEAREQLRSVLREWISFRVSKGLPLPQVPGVDLDAAIPDYSS
jgi:predicted RNase H-like HicB family nuclease